MGYAVFTARKIMITNKINTLNFKAMMLSFQQQNIQQQSADAQRMYNAYSYWGNQAMNSLNNMGYGNSSNYFAQQLSDYQYPMMNQLAYLNFIESDIEAQQKAIETQLKALNAELESIEKAEDQAIKRSAPKYG